jgi:hypothetical protein
LKWGTTILERWRQGLRFAREHPLRAVEVVIALGAAVFLLSQEGLRAVWLAVLRALVTGTFSALSLMATDLWGTLVTSIATLLKAALVTVPAARFWANVKPYRRVWLPLYGVLWGLSLPMIFPAISTPLMAALLVFVSAAGWFAAKRPRLRAIALLPTLVAFEPALSHSPLSDVVWTRERLAARCAQNDGARPEGFSAEKAVSRYFGVTELRADWLLLTGERGSYWIRRRPDGTAVFEEPSRVSGNLWEGCLAGGDIWLTKLGRLYRVTRSVDPDDPKHERIEERRLKDPPGLGIELDFTDAICDEPRGSIYAGELLRGGLRELVLSTGEVRRTEVGGLNLQVHRRSDGKFVGIDTRRLFVLDPDRREVIEEHAAGIATLGIDICPLDDAVVVTDLAGRLRLFRRGPGGHYAFERGLFLAAPRRVAFSPDCSVLGVTSGDDRTVYVLRRSNLEVLRTYSIGPGLRDITFWGPDELAAADACAVTLLKADE